MEREQCHYFCPKSDQPSEPMDIIKSFREKFPELYRFIRVDLPDGRKQEFSHRDFVEENKIEQFLLKAITEAEEKAYEKGLEDGRGIGKRNMKEELVEKVEGMKLPRFDKEGEKVDCYWEINKVLDDILKIIGQ